MIKYSIAIAWPHHPAFCIT